MLNTTNIQTISTFKNLPTTLWIHLANTLEYKINLKNEQTKNKILNKWIKISQSYIF